MFKLFSPASVISRLLAAYGSASFILLATMPSVSTDTNFTKPDFAAAVPLYLTLAVTAVAFLLLTLVSWLLKSTSWERVGFLLSVFGCILITTVYADSIYYTLLCMGILSLSIVYAFRTLSPKLGTAEFQAFADSKPLAISVLSAIMLLFVLYGGTLLTLRVLLHLSPGFDFGIFTQMFYSMRTEGLPLVTNERDKLLSHFAVHVSPVFYLLLPVYMLFPSAITLQWLQIIVLASAAIPLYRLARRQGLRPMTGAILGVILLLYPPVLGGSFYDLHENVFLLPFLLWLIHSADGYLTHGGKRDAILTAVFALLVFSVKEDAPIYVLFFGIYLMLRFLSDKNRRCLFTGAALTVGSLAYFAAVISLLGLFGEGAMNGRYDNFFFGGGHSLLTVVQSVIVNPMKVFYECADSEKWEFILQTMLPLGFLPFITRRWERLVLTGPYLLVNLMSDYVYQHSITFHYVYGAAALLFYALLLNLRDLLPYRRMQKLLYMLLASIVLFGSTMTGKLWYATAYRDTGAIHAKVDELLDTIPEDATVTASAYYIVPLSERKVIYNLAYTKHLSESDFIVLDLRYEDAELYPLYRENPDYTLYGEIDDFLAIFEKQSD